MIKAAGPWAGALPDPMRKRMLFTALGSAALGAAGAATLMTALRARAKKHKRA